MLKNQPTPSSQLQTPKAVKPLVVIVGETASGKSDLALRLAKELGGEIVCADSRTVYKGMDIGTAKPTDQERAQIPHHILDLIEPGERFSVADFKKLACEAIENISLRGRLPIMVGGTGLYVDSILYDYQFRPVNLAKRQSLEALDMVQLQNTAANMGITPEVVDFANARRLVRAIEAGGVAASAGGLRNNTLIVGLQLPREILRQRIETRIDKMIENGLIQEVERLGKKYGWSSEAMKGMGYRAFGEYLRGETDIDTARQKFVQGDINLARRQRTWFRRNKSIQWSDDPNNLAKIVHEFIMQFR